MNLVSARKRKMRKNAYIHTYTLPHGRLDDKAVIETAKKEKWLNWERFVVR